MRASQSWCLLVWVAVSGCDPGPARATVHGLPEAGPAVTVGAAPLIPAWSEAWADPTPEFVADPGFYGEANWDDVVARVLQHQVIVMRDSARLQWRLGQVEKAWQGFALATGYAMLAPTETGIGARLRTIYAEANRRDAALVKAVGLGQAPPIPAGGLSRLRALMLAGRSRAELEVEAAKLDLPALDPGDFTDYQARQDLRVALVEAALDAADPFAIPDTWGIWDPASRLAVRDAILASADGPVELPLSARPAWWLHGSPAHFTAEGLGALPTGDSTVDVLGEPGPQAIGQLELLSLTDPGHRVWLDAQANALNAALASGGLDALASAMITRLDQTPWTSRYYNVKQARNELIRQLARAGRYQEAASIISSLPPLHDQDRACPNRAGILAAIEGRLLALAGAPGATAAYQRALDAGSDFLKRVAQARLAGTGAPP